MKKIVFLTVDYLPSIGGIQEYIQQISKYLIQEGHEVCIICLDKNTQSVTREVINGARVIRFSTIEIGNYYFLKNRSDALKEIEYEIERADVVHHNAPKFLFKYIAQKKKKYNYKLIVSSHGWFYHTKTNTIIKNIYFKTIVSKYAPLYDAIINVSFQDKKIAERFGVYNTCVIENGVDIYKYACLPPKESFGRRFVYYGRIAENKGILECLVKLSTYNEDFVFDIIGECRDPSYYKRLLDFVKKNGMSSHVVFWGKLSENEIKERLTEADIILMPSNHEGFGMTLVECLLTGRPIIANNNESFRTILKNVCSEGYVFDYRNTQSNFTQKVDEVINSPITPRNVERYSIQRMIDETVKTYGI